MSTHTFIAVTPSGDIIDNRGRGYVSRRAAQQAAERRGTVAVETCRIDGTVPRPNDAQGWADYCLRHGHT